MSLVLNVEILGEFKKLTEATKGSQKSLNSLESNAKNISKKINMALGAIGVGFSLNFLVNQFKDSTKAAIEDTKSKELLNQALENNLDITKAQVSAIDQYITRTQIATGITDDNLRPAFAKLAIATKDTDEAMRLMSIATDVAAGTGKSLDTVVQAMSRSLAGSDTALTRLVPSIKGAKDPMAELEKTFSGAAKAAADTDPYNKMQIIFGELQEQIGMALLPVLTKFSTWLSTPEGQEKMQAIVDGVVMIITKFGELISWIDTQVMPILEALTGEKGFGAVITAVTTFVGVLAGLKVAMFFLSMGNPILAGILAGITAIAAGMAIVYTNTKNASSAFQEFQRLQNIQRVTTTPSTPEQVAAETYQGIIPQLEKKAAPAKTVPQKPGAVKQAAQTVNINVNKGNVTAKEIVSSLQKYQAQTGTSRILLK